VPEPQEPYALVLELSRTYKGDEAVLAEEDLRKEPRVYRRGLAETTLSWDDRLIADIDALRAPTRDPAIVHRLGDVLRGFLKKTDWSKEEADLTRAVDARREVHLTLRSNAAELYILPWELLELGESKDRIGELPNVTVRYDWRETKTSPEHPSPRPEGGRILLAYSTKGGAVKNDVHEAAIQDACEKAGHDFNPGRNVLAEASHGALREKLAEARKQGQPIAVLQLLAHGGPAGSTFGLMLQPDKPRGLSIDSDRLVKLIADHADMVRLVLLLSCDSGNTGKLGNHMGSVAQFLHRKGVAAVVASRLPISVDGAGEFARVFYEELLVPPSSVETAFVKARTRLSELEGLDWASVQLYAREADGFDTRPIVFKPYLGLKVYREGDRRFFRGREAETEALVKRLRDGARMLTVLGASGSGKSSLVQGGVVPEVLAGGLRDERPVRVAVLRPGAHASAIEAAIGKDEGSDVLLVVDQFEELFTQGVDPRDAEQFVATLLRATADPAGRVWAVLTLRADFYGRCLDFDDDLAKRVKASQETVLPMGEKELRKVIEEPAALVGLRFGEGVVDALMDALREGAASGAQARARAGNLPLLAFALEALWQERRGREIPWSTWKKLGGVKGAIAKRAEEVLGQCEGEAGRDLARRLFNRLVHVGQGTEDTRRVATRQELLAIGEGAEKELERWVQARLVTADHDRVEVVHEAVIREWGTLRGWIDGEREALLVRQDLGAAAKRWHDAKRPSDELWPSGRLDAVAELRKTGAWVLLKEEEAFLAAGEAAVKAAMDEKEAARRKLERATLMAGTRELVARGRHDTASMVLAAVNEPEQARGWTQLARDMLVHGFPRSTLRHEGFVRSAAWSPDGKRIVTASDDNIARVWNADGQGDPIVLKGHEGTVCSAAWSPDGKCIVTASDDNTARVWNADGQGDPIVLKGHEDDVNSAAWSPDGKRIVTASDDNTARVWNADGQGDPTILKSHEGPVHSAAWSPDGEHIVTASLDKTARVWNADGQSGPIVLKGHEDWGLSAAWSPDGKRIVSASGDKTARVWNVDGQGDPIVLKGHESAVTSAAWSPDGKRIVTASHDKTARVWNADGQGDPIVLKGHEKHVYSAAWSPDGKRILTASGDNTARIWLLDIPALQQLLRDATTDSLTPRDRSTYLLETEAEARAAYEASERSHGRTPWFGVAAPEAP
jgi:WD40 repeat protein